MRRIMSSVWGVDDEAVEWDSIRRLRSRRGSGGGGVVQ